MIGICKVKLRPCPFCGHEPRLENLVVEAVVVCHGCGARILRRHDPKLDTGIKDAQQAWNSRVAGEPPEACTCGEPE